MKVLPAKLLAVTDRHQAARPLPEVVADLLAAGVRWIWLRDRDLPADERRALADELAALTRAAGAVLTIGADLDLAEAVGAQGIQLRQASDIREARRRLGPDALLGVSTHSLGDIRAAAGHGADYVTLSPIFSSASKPGYGPALGFQGLADATRIGIPVLALGGVTGETGRTCIAAGASGVAIMGPLMRAGTRYDVSRLAEDLLAIFEASDRTSASKLTHSGDAGSTLQRFSPDLLFGNA